MKIDIISLFPEMFKGPFDESIIHRASQKSLVEIKIHNLRIWTKDKRGTVDDKPYGGGTGMVLMVTPIAEAIKELKTQEIKNKTKVILLSPRGKVWNQQLAKEHSKIKHLILICGHYEGVDERVKNFADEEISIGDYVLTGGEIPAMVLVDSIIRLIPGVLEKTDATELESFSPPSLELKHQRPILEYPQYTRPENFQGLKVPKILLSGDHKKISEWRQKEALKKTKRNRPDLMERYYKK